MQRDFYELLGVERDANQAELKTAFRRVARELHPDVNDHDPEAEEKFKAAAEAYEVLSDPERRRAYDAYGHEGLRGAGAPPGGGFGSVEDIFQAFFGGGFGFEVRRGPMRGRDLLHQVEISAVDAMLGTKLRVRSREGEREVELPPGVQPGSQFALRGQGMPGANGGPPGDLVIAVQVIVPDQLSAEQRELAERLGETIEPRNLRPRHSGEESFFSRVRRAFG